DAILRRTAGGRTSQKRGKTRVFKNPRGGGAGLSWGGPKEGRGGAGREGQKEKSCARGVARNDCFQIGWPPPPPFYHQRPRKNILAPCPTPRLECRWGGQHHRSRHPKRHQTPIMPPQALDLRTQLLALAGEAIGPVVGGCAGALLAGPLGAVGGALLGKV